MSVSATYKVDQVVERGRNQLFRWRRQLLPKAVVESGAMVPVEIAPDGDRPRRTDREGVKPKHSWETA